MKPVVLLTGGAGYIGAHCAVALCDTGRYKVIIVDNLANSCLQAVEVVLDLCKGEAEYINCDIANDPAILKSLHFDAVIHFAALKAVGESVAKPLDYYRNNLNALLNVVDAARAVGCKHFVFSSSATVYRPSEVPLTEDAALGASNPYGQTKVVGEQILQDLFISDGSWHIAMLRYFNPVGAHPSGRMGEAPDVPQNILPIVQKVAIGKLDCVTVCGNDWPTRDGTGVRDYIHVVDLAEGHIAALDKIFSKDTPSGCYIWNLGSGTGYSVMEIIKEFEKAAGRKINYKIGPRRPGDLATVVCDPSKAERDLGFKVKRSLTDACESAWKWQSTHPNGFKTV